MTSDRDVIDPAAQRARIVGIGDTRFAFEPHNCFACGSLNASGLNLVLHVGDDHCWTEITLPERFEGWHGIAHGGIVATILDEVMAWALVHQDVWGVTARMSIEFRRPIRIGVPIRAQGRMTSRRRRVFETSAVIVDPITGDELATGSGIYVAAPEERKQELKERYGFRILEPAETSAR